jgi:hypothetical protein
MSRDSSEVKNFWQEYQAAVLRQGIPQAKSEWYGRWAQRFTRFVPDLPLRACTAAHVRAFLTDLGHQSKVEPWQVDQAQEALRVLYQECIPRPWARPRPFRAQAMETGRGLSHGKSFRDEVSSGEVDVQHQTMLSRLRTEIRTRHYSLRTERAYEHWIRRFATFHRLKSPHELGPEAVKEYLEFLAEERHVSASTQNQALNALVFLYEQVLGEPAGNGRGNMSFRRAVCRSLLDSGRWSASSP